MSDEDTWPIAIDPPECGCTECITGEYVPLERVTREQIVDLLTGRIANHLSDWHNEHTSVTVTVRIDEHSWELTPEQGAQLIGTQDPGSAARVAEIRAALSRGWVNDADYRPDDVWPAAARDLLRALDGTTRKELT